MAIGLLSVVNLKSQNGGTGKKLAKEIEKGLKKKNKNIS